MAVKPMVWRSAGALTARIEKAPSSATQPDDTEQIEERIEIARRNAHKEGEVSGRQLALLEIEPAVRTFSALVQELANERSRVRHEMEEDVVRLAIAIAQRVLHRELSTDPEAILGLVKAAFQKLNAREIHKLRVSPDHAAVIQEYRSNLNLPVGLELMSDGSLVSGSVIFETARGELDASVDTQLAEIERGLTDVVKRRGK